MLHLNDEGVILRLESLIKDEKKKLHEKELKPITVGEFCEMIDQARQDSDGGRVISHENLKKKIKS